VRLTGIDFSLATVPVLIKILLRAAKRKRRLLPEGQQVSKAPGKRL